MTDDKTTGNLPTELITEKTFYTLGGASAAVLLTCWAINYVAVDASWLNYKSYRLIGLILSEVFAIVIMYKTAKKNSMKWIFAFLNGLLIFVNASGLNTMTSSYVFNPADSTTTKQGDSRFRQFRDNKVLKTGIFALPRMISWWPDEKLVKEFEQSRQENSTLASANNELRTILDNGNEGTKALFAHKDSLMLVINSMQATIDGKQKQVDQLTETIKGGNDDLSRQLAACLNDRDKRIDELRACQLSGSQLNARIDDLKREIVNLNKQLRNCGGKNVTLADLLQLVCNKNSQPEKIDDKLRKQAFYKKMNWSEFCKAFNVWNNVVE